MNTQSVSLFNKPAGIKHVMYVFRIEIVLGHNELSSMWPYHNFYSQLITQPSVLTLSMGVCTGFRVAAVEHRLPRN